MGDGPGMLAFMDLLLHFRAFVRVAELGGFSAAARALNASQPAISRQVADLEARLGARLLHRSSTGVALTEEGRAFLDAARVALDAADGAVSAVGALRGEVAGDVRLGTPLGFGRLHVIPRIGALMARHPALSIDLVMADAFGDLVTEGLDATIRIGVVTDPGLIIRRIGVTRRVMVAAPAYLARAGTPREPADLAGHECLRFAGHTNGEVWSLDGPGGVQLVPITGRFRANTGDAMLAALLAGLGLFPAPLWLVAPELAAGRLVQVMPGWSPPTVPIQIAFSSRRQVPHRVRVVADFLAGEFRLDPVLTDYGLG